MTASPIRWQQRFDQYRRVLRLLKTLESDRRERPLSDGEKAGFVQFFGLTVELGWKTFATLLRSQLVDVHMVPIHVVRAAADAGLIDDADLWANAIEQRNLMAHVYDVDAFDAFLVQAAETYTPIFDLLEQRLAQTAAN